MTGQQVGPLEEWFWDFVDASGDCWLWIGGRSSGYGWAAHPTRKERAHRVSWELLVGPIPEGHQIDHLCRVPTCVNPDHLQPVTPKVNVLRSFSATAINARKTECHKGHPFNEANTYRPPGRGRQCRRCQYLRNIETYQRQRARKVAT